MKYISTSIFVLKFLLENGTGSGPWVPLPKNASFVFSAQCGLLESGKLNET